jgi:Helix-turn-helix domain
VASSFPDRTATYLTLAELAEYSRISVRQLRKYLALPPGQALPCYRPGRRVVVRRDEFDAWFQQYRRRGKAVITRVFQELGLDPLRELRKPPAKGKAASGGR